MRQTNWNNKHSATRLLLLFAVCFSVFIYTAMLLIAEKLGYKFYFSSCFVRFSVFFPLIFWIFCLFAGLVCFEHAPLKTATRNKFLGDVAREGRIVFKIKLRKRQANRNVFMGNARGRQQM